MENNKFTPIAMKCNEAQFKEVEPILKENGLKLIDIFKEYSYLINNYANRKGEVSNVPNETKGSYNRKVYEEWDKETFLKACGIEIEPKVFTCKDLSEGRVACINDGTIEDIGKVLKYCFPEDKGNPYMTFKYYGKCKSIDNRFDAFSNESLKIPTQSVKVFLKEIELEEKEFLEKVKMQDTTILGYDPDNVEQPPLKKFINLSSKETAKKETVFTHGNFGGDWFTINSNAYKEQIKQIYYHGELENGLSLFVAELNDGELVILKGIKGDEFND